MTYSIVVSRLTDSMRGGARLAQHPIPPLPEIDPDHRQDDDDGDVPPDPRRDTPPEGDPPSREAPIRTMRNNVHDIQ